MDRIRCPHCGAICYPGLMGFPRCHRCHEQLRQCRWCAHQSRGLCTLEPQLRPPLREEQDKPYCEAFTTALAVSEDDDPWRRELRVSSGTLGFGAGLIILVAIIVAFVISREPRTYRIEAIGGHVPVLDGRAVARFEVDAEPGLNDYVTIAVSDSVLQTYDLLEPSPTPVEVLERPRRYVIPEQSDGTLKLRLTFLPKDASPPPYQELTVSVLGVDGAVESSSTIYLTARPPKAEPE